MNAEKSGWTVENIKRLFVEMKRSTPRIYATCPYTKGLKHVDWNKVAFAPFSAEDCKQRWRLQMKKMRKQRSLTELIVEAEDVLSEPVLNSKIHPLFPRRPPPSTALFYEENWDKIQEQHPELSHNEVFAASGKAYRELPDRKKAPYVKKYQLALHEYREKKKEFRKTHLKLDVEDAEGLPPKPPLNGYRVFCKEQYASLTEVSNRNYMKLWAQRWQELTNRQKKEYSEHCTKMKKTYTIKLLKCIKTLDEEEQERILHDNAKYMSKETLTAAEQEEYQESNTNTCRYVNVKRSSDSEDEDITDSSSDEEEVYLDCVEDGEEEEEGDITFDMY